MSVHEGGVQSMDILINKFTSLRAAAAAVDALKEESNNVFNGPAKMKTFMS